MGWFLWRKPYPGFTGVEEIPLLTDEVFLGRGKDCTVHCLSLFVSRRHLKIIPKENGTISLQDLGSSNGTFVNQSKISPNVEFPLNLGDEIGIGNITNESKDCFVYEVRNNEISSAKIEEQVPVDVITLKESQPPDVNQSPRHQLERGLKRFIDEPEIVVLDDDEADEDNSKGVVVEVFSKSPKRLKLDSSVQSLTVNSTSELCNGTRKSNCQTGQEDISSKLLKKESNLSSSSNYSVTAEQMSGMKKMELETSHCVVSNSQITQIKQDPSSSSDSGNLRNDLKFSPPQTITSTNVKSESVFQKPPNERVSSILEESSNASSRTIKLSSPLPSVQSTLPVVCSTPLPCKTLKLEDTSRLTMTPSLVKSEDRAPSTVQNGVEFSPIVKDSSRLSQGSSANYTLDEELIPIDLSDDDDDEIFPCSQMFAEPEDVKPCLEDLDKEMGVVDLSGDEEPPGNVQEADDDVVLISDGEDEDEDEIQEVNKWLHRLSQSSTKIEIKDEPQDEPHIEPQDENFQSVDPPEEEHDDIWEELTKDEEQNDLCRAEHDADANKFVADPEDVPVSKRVMEEKETKTKTETHKKDKKGTESHSEKSHKGHKHRSKGAGHNEKHSSRHKRHGGELKESRRKEKEIVGRLRKTFGESSSEDEDTSSRKQKPRERTSADIAFDALLNKPDGELDLSGEGKQLQVSLDRLEEDPHLVERYGLSSSLSPKLVQPPSAPSSKKAPRKIELVDALPNPPRKASNRGISMETTRKMYDIGKQRTRDEPKRPKSKEDTKALRKERLARMAAQCGSKDTGNSELKRSAPAKAKVSRTNRGTFLTETDDSSPINKPKSRKEILDGIKIPKRKDKTVVDLPSKSPLEALNMSWEKKPASAPPPPQVTITTQSNAAPPVEIPTGPQPKKRVAQKPPPGFYEERKQEQQVSLGEEPRKLPVSIRPPVLMKSCLSGSSKHNITMNDTNSSVSKKKRVQFKENLVQIKYIDPLPNTRPVNSARDADRPAPMSQFLPPKLPKGPLMPNDESILQDVIYDISKWNPLWLKEEKDLPPDVAPPVVSNMVMPTLPKTEFLDFREYHENMYPLLMLELWNGVSKEYNTRMNNSRNNLIMAVDSASSASVLLRPDRMLTTLTCHMLADERSGAEHPRLGNLVIIDLALKDPSEKLVIIPVFGYVSFDTKDRLRKTDQFHKDLVSQCRNPVFKIRFNLQIRERKNCTFVLERPMRIKHVKYVRGDLRMFQAMKNLEYTPLQYSILSPMSACEDFTLPDVSQRNLTLNEQLNPTQKQIVLQTAEVCLQDKPKICLIQGPPGTGKTHVIESLVMHLLYRDGMYSRHNRERGLTPRILLCAPSNNAVDLLVARLLRRRAKFQKEHRLKMVRVGQSSHEDVRGVSLQELANVAMKQDRAMHDTQGFEIDIGNLAAKLRGIENQISDLCMNSKQPSQELLLRQADIIRRLKILEDRKKQQQQTPSASLKHDFAFERETKKKILRGADIIGTTLNSCVVKVMETVFPPTSPGKYHFQVCIVDEATQCLEVETLIPLLVGVKTLVLVGDHLQLPATILSKIARDKGLGTSLFKRLQNVVPNAVQMLEMQYRMHPEILRWPNKFFYNRRLKCPDQILSIRDSRVLPYTVLSLPFQQDRHGESNTEEAKLVLQLAELLIDEKVIHHDFRVGIVTPYQSQRRVIESMIARIPKLTKPVVEVSTIDSCQGQEKDIIIISCVRTNGVGFLADRQRINVALTRAKYALFICGNFSSLDRDNMWNNLLADARHRNCLIEMRDHYNKEDLWSVIHKK